MLLALLLFYLLFKVWPPALWPPEAPHTPITFFGKFSRLSFQIYTSLDERLIFLVIVAGALGSYIHSATSFADYVGNRKFVKSWMWWYLLRSFVGISLALTFYFVVRAGFLMGGADDVSPYGVATLAALSGMYSKQATDKLEEVFTTLFRPSPGKGDAKRGDKLSAPTITEIAPVTGPTSGGTDVTITGMGFVDKTSVMFGGLAGVSSFVNANTMKATTPPHESGSVDVVLTNPDGHQVSSATRFTYLATEDSTGVLTDAVVTSAQAADELDADVDATDGCDVDILDETPDEDLPIAEGGVA